MICAVTFRLLSSLAAYWHYEQDPIHIAFIWLLVCTKLDWIPDIIDPKYEIIFPDIFFFFFFTLSKKLNTCFSPHCNGDYGYLMIF